MVTENCVWSAGDHIVVDVRLSPENALDRMGAPKLSVDISTPYGPGEGVLTLCGTANEIREAIATVALEIAEAEVAFNHELGEVRASGV